MEPLTLKQWIALAAVVTVSLIPIIWYYWRIWDRPSRAAKEEMARRKHETEMREIFMREELKLKAEEAEAAKQVLARKKAQAPKPVSKEALSSAFGDLDAETSDPIAGGAAAGGDHDDDVEMTGEFKEIDIPRIKEMLDELPEVDFEEDEVHEGPIAVQLRGGAVAGDGDGEHSNGASDDPGEQPPPAPDLDEWDVSDW